MLMLANRCYTGFIKWTLYDCEIAESVDAPKSTVLQMFPFKLNRKGKHIFLQRCCIL